ncbi:MAG: methyltransferase domain-containing protein [Candidatus Omnitrophica bacterium]|nr:methyltransferase domain-containing protein [Candidatus Omnitrophota bacterium]MDD5352943.1 methyltransferase domain-containing protein [Candidatus Omnitrophota bacterium]MDD5550542.1 methyltransferase domain-containing protein [Candidatus Omnitrophota bacterium]
MTKKNISIQEEFSKASVNYDESALLQREIADELFERIILPDYEFNALDIGCGTGYLIEKFQNVGFINGICAVDIALGMLEVIRKKNLKAELFHSDATKLPFKDGAFDLVISNLAYQWVSDLGLAFREAKRVLKDNGEFYFTIFTENTLKELREVISQYLKVDIKDINAMGYLPKSQDIWKILEDNKFSITKTDLKNAKQYYSDLLELLYGLKNIGANKYWSKSLYKGLSSRGFIENISKIYEKNFKEGDRIFATFEVMFVEATHA